GERLAYMLEARDPKVLLTQSSLGLELGGLGESTPVLDLDVDTPAWAQQPPSDPAVSAVELNPRHLAYVIYTSGSTGLPKGVMVEHAGLCNYLRWALNNYVPETSVVSSSFSFDGTITSLFTPLLRGGTVLLLRENEEIDGLYAQ